MTDHHAQLRQALVTAADRSSPCHRVLRHYQDRQVAVRPVDFCQALKAVDEAVVRLQLEGVAPIDCRASEDGIEFATDLIDAGTASRDDFLDKVSTASTVSVIHHVDSEFADGKDGQEVRADGGIKMQDICDEFVREQAVSADDAESWVHIGVDSHFHPAGGYWFPTGETWGDSSGWVSRKSKIPHGGIVQYPCSEKEPDVRGKDEVPDYVVNRTLSTETEQTGLYEKYDVRKNGEAIEDCFVLKPGDDPAAREALIRYAEATDDEELATDLREWVTDLCTRGDRDV